jgi:hypothetical protein
MHSSAMNQNFTIENAVAGCFNQPSGPARPGIDWNIRLDGHQPVKVTVRTYFPHETSDEDDMRNLADKAMFFITYKVASGWLPEAGAFEVED